MITFPSAKINIGLNVTSKRPDGYHNLETIFYPIKIKDALEVIEGPEMSFETSGVNIPGDATENLCLKAYQLLRKDFDLPNIKIHLHKHIPIGAGLGGGSADASFFIKLINRKFNLGLSTENMQRYCRKLGADCAFFIENAPVFAHGKGDEFEPIHLDLSSYFITLVMPSVRISTAEAYQGVHPLAPKTSLKQLIQLPIEEWQNQITNDFENHILKIHPPIGAVKAALLEAGALFSLMSGSGASVYGIFEKPTDLSALETKYLVFKNV